MKDFKLVNKIVHRISDYVNSEDFMWLLLKAIENNNGENTVEDKELIQRLIKRVEYLESLDHIKNSDNIRDIVNDLNDRMSELEYKLDSMKEL